MSEAPKPSEQTPSRFEKLDSAGIDEAGRQIDDQTRQTLVSHGKATNAARDLAEEYGLCLGYIDGSGHEGRVVKADVEEALEALRKKFTEGGSE